MQDRVMLLNKLLTKKAKGYTVKEYAKEYSVVEGQLTMTKQKVTTKHVPPDINAIKALLQLSNMEVDNITDMTDEQLQVEKLRLLNMLNAIQPIIKEEPNVT